MQKSLFFILTILFSSGAALADVDCKNSPGKAINELKNVKNDPDLRAQWGACLFRNHFNNAEATQTLANIIRDPAEDILLREDLIEALADTPLRKKTKISMAPIAQVDKEEKEALAKNGRGLNALIEVTQAIRTAEEVVPASKYEGDFFKALSEVSVDDSAHILLRLTALSALEKITETTIASGVYDARYLKVAQESMQAVAMRDDPVAHYSGLHQNYEKIVATFPKSPGAPGESGRAISSQK